MEKFKIDKYLTQKENDVFLILTGLGGNTKGYENKYETISKMQVLHMDLMFLL